ncbi:MAG: LCP family protein [Anaerolineales bacterium]|nr:LCP family protein [Anaerolineales bacterium]
MNYPRNPQPMPDGKPHRSLARRVTLFFLLGYTVVALSLAGAIGFRLHDWARQRIVQLSVLANFDDEMPAASVPAGEATPAPVAMQGAPNAPLTPATPAATATPPPINILLLGTDERPDEYSPSRTDTMILLSVSPNDQSIGMLSMPRDLWVPIPGQNITTKINTAYMLGELNKYPGGGPQLAKDTVSSFIGRPVDYFVRVNFDGFREIIDQIGGIDINIPYTIHDDEYPTVDYGVETFHLDAGLQHLDGATALKYARTRHGDSDYGRARRQQDIIRAVAEKVLNAGMIPQLLLKAPQLLRTMQDSIQTDIPAAVAVDLANVINGSSLKEIRQLVLDKQYGEETYSSEGAWILMPDRAKVRTALDQFFQPTASPAVANSADAPVRVEVLNGTSQPGIGARTAQLLQEQGWTVVSVGDADRSDYAQTIVVSYGAPTDMVQKISSDLYLEPAQSALQGLNTTAPVEMRVVVGNDLIAHLK